MFKLFVCVQFISGDMCANGKEKSLVEQAHTYTTVQIYTFSRRLYIKKCFSLGECLFSH